KKRCGELWIGFLRNRKDGGCQNRTSLGLVVVPQNMMLRWAQSRQHRGMRRQGFRWENGLCSPGHRAFSSELLQCRHLALGNHRWLATIEADDEDVINDARRLNRKNGGEEDAEGGEESHGKDNDRDSATIVNV